MSNPQDLLPLVSKMVLAAGTMISVKKRTGTKENTGLEKRRQNSKVLAKVKKTKEIEQLDLLRMKCKAIGSLKLQEKTNMHIREIR